MSNLTDLTGLVAAFFVILAFFSHKPKPLRIFAILSNVLFVSYAADVGLMPVLMLHAVLLPLNVIRLLQLLRKPAPRGQQPDNDMRSVAPLDRARISIRPPHFLI